MHLLLTDRLSCPRCGPTFGLILRADRVQSRSVAVGVLGCPNCRDSFPIQDGFADLRAPPRGAMPPGLAGPPGAADPVGVERLVALLGVVGGPGTIALVGESARLGHEVAVALPDLQIVAVDPDMQGWPDEPSVNRLASGPGLPFFGSALRAAAVDGRLGPRWLAEAARAVSPKGRVVVLRAPEDTSVRLGDHGLSVLASEAGTVVATRG